eukprot:7380536-Prymnesium_polylepis.1
MSHSLDASCERSPERETRVNASAPCSPSQRAVRSPRLPTPPVTSCAPNVVDADSIHAVRAHAQSRGTTAWECVVTTSGSAAAVLLMKDTRTSGAGHSRQYRGRSASARADRPKPHTPASAELGLSSVPDA